MGRFKPTKKTADVREYIYIVEFIMSKVLLLSIASAVCLTLGGSVNKALAVSGEEYAGRSAVGKGEMINLSACYDAVIWRSGVN